MKTKVGMLFVLVVLLAVSVSAAAAPAYLNETGFPIVKEPIKLTMVVGQGGGGRDFGELLVYQEYEKMTGIEVEWTMIPLNVLTEKRNLLIVSGEYPDAFHSARFTEQDLMLYGSQGIFIPLNDLIDEYAPNLKKILDENPDIRRGLTMPDGNIYSFPQIYDPEFTSVLAARKLWIKKEYMDALGIEKLETLEDLYEYLKGVKYGDPNGNGINDEIPILVSNDSYIFDTLRGAFGLGNRGMLHQHVDVDPKTGELRFIPTSEEYKAFLQYLNRLYQEGLITQDIYTLSSAEITARAQDGLLGAMITTNPRTGYGTEGYVGAPALEGPFGDKLYTYVNSPLVTIGAFVITDKNPYPEATVRWVDHFYSDEGAKLFFMGIEGITYVELEDGSVDYTDLIYNNPKGLSFADAVSSYVPYRNAAYPAIVKQAFFKGSEGQPDSIAAAEQVAPYFPEVIWPQFSFTVEEMDVMASVGADVDSYVTEMRAAFLTGNVSLDEWDRYVSTLERMGLKRYMEVYQAAYERYLKQ
ncbi:MAG: extracellular solute-binding protein [Firmicutes bacterium]|nr:extracellular solute-binding protein [Bacillota bacterium]